MTTKTNITKDPVVAFETSANNYDFTWLWSYLYSQGYHIVETEFCVKDIDQFLAAVPHTDLRDRRKFSRSIMFYSGDLFFVIASPSRYCSIFSKGGQKSITEFLTRYEDLFDTTTARTIGVIYYYMDGGKIDATHVSLDLDKLHHTYPELYPDIDIELLNQEFNKSSDSILVLYGPPGVGKTTFLKYMLDVGHYGEVIYVKDMNVMKSGGFWCKMVGRDYGLLILDDLDFALAPRRDDSDSTFVSNLLSYSDGIFNKSSKIVITTNQPVDQMDNALMRPGRCFDFLTLQPLTQKQAQAFWVDHLKRPMSEYYDNFDHKEDFITQAEIMSIHRRLEVGICRSYMRDGSVVSLEDRLLEAGVNVGSEKVSF